MITDPWFYAVAVPAVLLMGLSKGGLAGVGTVATPLMALAVAPVQAASIALPILIVQDAVSVWAFRKTFDKAILVLMIPAAIVGIVIGWALARFTTGGGVEFALGAISVLFGLHRLWAERHRATPAKPLPKWLGFLCGIGSGFTSQVAHAGAPPFQMYVMPMRLERDMLVGTTAIFFASVNWLKVPAYVALGQFTRETLTTAAVLLPLAIVTTYAGVWVVRKLNGDWFYRIVYILLVAVGLKLMWDGGVAIWG